MTVTLRPMTQDEYERLSPVVVESFAAKLLEAGHATSPEDARTQTLAQIEQLLPEGIATTWMLLMVAESRDDGIVGQIWLSLPGTAAHPDTAWVYNVEVSSEHRGKGYGRAIMLGAEQELKARGVERLGLNVFGSNRKAIALYDSLGFAVMSQQMSKPLT
jgi:ribosomal protein S18 acetylase RimI-like enzyme